MAYRRNTNWEEDGPLKADFEKYVEQDLRRTEILDFLKRDYGQYAWSLSSLDRRLRHFGIYYTNTNVTVGEVREAVEKEIDGPGKCLGYRAMQKKLRQEYHLKVPRDLVYAVMTDVDSDGLQARAFGNAKKKRKGKFSTMGANWVHSFDGHDKLMGYQNSTFPLAIYGCIDTASRKILWLKIWVSNSDPQLIGYWYLEYLFESKVIASFMRLDKGTETGTIATMHAYLQQFNDAVSEPTETVIYGPSTSNQIERWWRELHERMERYFKEHLRRLLAENHYDPHNEIDR